MSPEREILNLWLSQNGYFTISRINAGKNRVIDTIALKSASPPSTNILHIEVACSVSSTLLTAPEKQELLKRFTHPNVERAVKRAIAQHLREEYPFENVLVTNYENARLEGVRVIPFGEVLTEVLNSMDRQNYRNSVIRTVQLIKYLLLSSPRRLSAVLAHDGRNKALTHPAREALVKELLPHSPGLFRKPANERMVAEILAASTLKNPERLGRMLVERMSTKSANRLLAHLLNQKGRRPLRREKRQGSLERFIRS